MDGIGLNYASLCPTIPCLTISTINPMYVYKRSTNPSTPWAYTFGFLVRASDSGSRKMKKNIISMTLVFFIYEHIKYTFVEFSQLFRKKIVSI